jgi:hypothetical protein
VTATATTEADRDLRDLREAAPEEYPELRVDPGLKEAAAGPNIVSLRSAVNAPKGERVPAFSINGRVYTILTRPKTNAGLKYIHLARTKGAEIAVDFMLETLLGTEGYEALMDFDDLTEADLTAVIEAASRIMAGAVEAPKDKPQRASRRSAG